MDSRKTLFKFYDAFRMSAFLRLFIPFAVSLIGALIFASIFTSCERAVLSSDDDDIEEVVSKGKGELYVTCSFSQTQSEITRASSVSLSECATRVQYVIMQGETMVYNSEQINGGGNSFGTLSVNLEPGTYRLMVFAHNEKNGNPISVGTDGSIQGYNNRVTESFSYSDEVVIVKDKRKTVSCKLTRCVAMVNFTSTDKIPAEVSKFKLTLTGISSRYDLRNQIGADVTTYVTSMAELNSDRRTSEGMMADIHSYVFLPAIEATINAKFEFYNNANELVLTRNIEGIQMRINAKTSVTGTFFQSDGVDASITVDNDWGDEIKVEI
jgi:hypothetical protein